MNDIFDIKSYLGGNQEVFQILFQSKAIKIERIISNGQSTEWFDQDFDEFVVLMQGTACLEFKTEDFKFLKAGSFLHIPKHHVHRVSKSSSDALCLAIHHNFGIQTD